MATTSIKTCDIVDGTLPTVCARCGEPAVSKQFPWVTNSRLASWYLSRKGGSIWFWIFILWKQYVRPEPGRHDCGLPFCPSHTNYWPRRAWIIVGGLIALVLLFGVAYATDPWMRDSSRHQTPNLFTSLAGFCMLMYPVLSIVIHLSSMRVTRHDGQRVTLVGVNNKFIDALKASHPEYAQDKKPTHLEEFRQIVSDYAR